MLESKTLASSIPLFIFPDWLRYSVIRNGLVIHEIDYSIYNLPSPMGWCDISAEMKFGEKSLKQEGGNSNCYSIIAAYCGWTNIVLEIILYQNVAYRVKPSIEKIKNTSNYNSFPWNPSQIKAKTLVGCSQMIFSIASNLIKELCCCCTVLLEPLYSQKLTTGSIPGSHF